MDLSDQELREKLEHLRFVHPPRPIESLRLAAELERRGRDFVLQSIVELDTHGGER